eukprot:CAMPEP_0206634314 /NCGR_PEP_ID=MMETSP0325_2-20121206/69970_1 /ASSEMBLY_ACC=CAM_ASM_000347 /TAXON_ID=2866 /ORGANISM="Crypthecodinium cohnii, Strain Seligo" /LENGTH=106 /DNA_ID=CAMNT_0054160091 /DNA_START=180 /DNA_END=496 /DNA_ORIENTATION=-
MVSKSTRPTDAAAMTATSSLVWAFRNLAAIDVGRYPGASFDGTRALWRALGPPLRPALVLAEPALELVKGMVVFAGSQELSRLGGGWLNVGACVQPGPIAVAVEAA